jgi:DNA-directed RNA polymerase
MSWLTPLGLPVMQPYRKEATYEIPTVLQKVSLVVSHDSLPVSTRKQKTAFPPNFVHSLDSTHMILTSLKMKEKGLTFAAVHDSYWTHPSDVPIMNKVSHIIFGFSFRFILCSYLFFIGFKGNIC